MDTVYFFQCQLTDLEHCVDKESFIAITKYYKSDIGNR